MFSFKIGSLFGGVSEPMPRWMRRRKQETNGQGLIEWVLILALVCVVAIAGLTSSGGNCKSIFGTISGELTRAEATVGGWTPSNQTIGLAVGGAKDVRNFRENIKLGFIPRVSDISPEGLFYDYSFDTGATKRSTKLFSPSYSFAASRNPMTGLQEYWLSVGLNSNIREKDFFRKKLNLVVLIDVSGSMGEKFTSYYGGSPGSGASQEVPELEETGREKVRVAAQAVSAMLAHLSPDDRFALVTFNNEASLLAPLSSLDENRPRKVKELLSKLSANNGTNLEAGYRLASSLFPAGDLRKPGEFENRIILLTDAMPNGGDFSLFGLTNLVSGCAAQNIFTTIVGVGIDCNNDLTSKMAQVKGANSFSVHGPADFKRRLDTEFDFMVTPLVFDLKLAMESRGVTVEKVYGAPGSVAGSGEIMHVNTLFPSARQERETKGGIILLKLKPSTSEASLVLRVSYENRLGAKEECESDIRFTDPGTERFDNTGIRKGVLLARYVDLLHDWIGQERSSAGNGTAGSWDTQELPLKVSASHARNFRDFSGHFRSEMALLGDRALEKEAGLLDTLSGLAPANVQAWGGAGGEMGANPFPTTGNLSEN